MSSTLPGEDAHARMVVQGYLVAPWQAEDAQRECRLLVYVHVCHGWSPPTASAAGHILNSEATCQVKVLNESRCGRAAKACHMC